MPTGRMTTTPRKAYIMEKSPLNPEDSIVDPKPKLATWDYIKAVNGFSVSLDSDQAILLKQMAESRLSGQLDKVDRLTPEFIAELKVLRRKAKEIVRAKEECELLLKLVGSEQAYRETRMYDALSDAMEAMTQVGDILDEIGGELMTAFDIYEEEDTPSAADQILEILESTRHKPKKF